MSQFEISPLYSQINYRASRLRVSPLGYADLFKWFTNREAGIPGYALVNMTTQNAEIVRLDGNPIHYSQSEPSVRNIDRHVQLKYPFYMFDEKSFEIDEEGQPWWICPVADAHHRPVRRHDHRARGHVQRDDGRMPRPCHRRGAAVG